MVNRYAAGARRVLVGTIAVLAAAGVLMPAEGIASEPRISAAVFPQGPVIDGVLDDDVWARASRIEGFVQFEPEFGKPSPFRTRVLVGFTSDTLYIGFRNFDSEPERIAAAVTSRDGDMDRDDSVSVLLDTLHNGRTAYFFATNALGVQTDGKVADNGRTVETEWDASWECASRRTATGWDAEFAIPFKVLRFKGGEEVSWGVNFVRRVPRRLETSLWSGPGESQWRVSEFGIIDGLTVRATDFKKLAFIPYALIAAEKGEDLFTRIGADLRFRITDNLSGDLTINPDFALIEADVEEVNLTRFELFVPEKRPFFLEGNEMYTQRIRQFYSRRIGDITAGGKVVGEVGGFDVVAIATRADLVADAEPTGSPETIDGDYTVLRAQRGVFGSSTIGLLAANRAAEGENMGSIGVDATLFFTETIGMTGQLLRSHGPTNDGTLGWFLRPAYDSANTHFHIRYTSLDAGLKDNVNAVGFLKDDDRKEWDAEATHQIWFQESAFERIEGKINYNRYDSQSGALRSWELETEIELVLTSGWQFELSYDDGLEIFEKEFRNSITSLEVGYDNRAGRAINVGVGTGKNFDSDLQLVNVEVEFRLSKAWDLSYEATWLELDPDPEQESTWIHVFRSSYYFTNDLFLSLFVQTNSVISKENVQLLGVWRFLPPFGSLQIAYQKGTSEIGEMSEQDDTIFTKLPWVF